MKKIICIIITLTLVLSSTLATAFSDLSAAMWAKEAIDTLCDMGVINGYEDGSFRPHSNVTRAEFAKMLHLSLGTSRAPDQSSATLTHWAQFYIDSTHHLIYTPTPSYEPDRNASRAEIAYALAKALELEPSKEDMSEKFSDWHSVDGEIAQIVAASVESGIIRGYENGEIRGSAPVTRAEAATLIVRALEYKEKTDTPDGDEGENETGESETDENETDENESSADNKDDIFAGLDHLYTLYPYKNMMVVSEVTKVLSESSGDTAYKLTYKIAGEDSEEFTSVVEEEDVNVKGAKTSLSQIRAGDVFIISMVFLTRIDNIYVLASFDSDLEGAISSMVIPTYGSMLGAYDSNAEYEFLYGELIKKQVRDKSVTLTVKNDKTTYIINVPKKVKADVFTKTRRSARWESQSISTLDEGEGTALYIRLTDGKVTEVVAAILDTVQ